MLIGILQCGHAPDDVQAQHGDFNNMFAVLLQGQDFTFQTWNVVDQDFPSSPLEADGWLITGSKHGAYEDHAFIKPLTELIKDIYASAQPMVGVCFGHQLIAQALGGKVEKFNGGWAIGRQNYTFGTHGAVTLNAWHQDQVTALPPGAEVIASNDFCKYAAVIYGTKAYTIQPHPEFSNSIFTDYVSVRRHSTSYPPELMDCADQMKNVPTQDAIIAATLQASSRGLLNLRCSHELEK